MYAVPHDRSHLLAPVPFSPVLRSHQGDEVAPAGVTAMIDFICSRLFLRAAAGGGRVTANAWRRSSS
jgi:hypothetical protein